MQKQKQKQNNKPRGDAVSLMFTEKSNIVCRRI